MLIRPPCAWIAPAAFAAGYLVGGAKLAAETAARCVAQLGTMPPGTD